MGLCLAGTPHLSPFLLDLMPARYQRHKDDEVRFRTVDTESVDG